MATRQTTAAVIIAELAFALALIGIGTFAGAAGRLALWIGCAAAGLGLVAFAYVVFVRPEMLRSDRQVFVDSVLKFTREEDVDDRKLLVAERLLSAPKAPKDREGDTV